jgi:cell division protein FtsQ
MPAPPLVPELPLDVRLMNLASRVFFSAFALLALAGVLAWLGQQPVFSLKGIRVDNELMHNNAVTLRANVAPKLSGNFFTLDLAQARTAFEAVPWVRHAVVRREFPDRLRVALQEHEAVAFWGAEADARLVNSYGEVFEVNQGDVEPDELPLLTGPQGQAALVLQGFRGLAPLFEQLGSAMVHLELTGRGSWRARLDSGAVIEMGQGTPVEIAGRAQRLVATFTQTASRFGRDLESADLRYPNGYAIKLRGVTTVTADAQKKK